MKRQTGYYWIKIKENSPWSVCLYSKLAQCWSVESTVNNPAFSEDKELFEINEKRILNPSEVIIKGPESIQSNAW